MVQTTRNFELFGQAKKQTNKQTKNQNQNKTTKKKKTNNNNDKNSWQSVDAILEDVSVAEITV